MTRGGLIAGAAALAGATALPVPKVYPVNVTCSITLTNMSGEAQIVSGMWDHGAFIVAAGQTVRLAAGEIGTIPMGTEFTRLDIGTVLP